MNRLSPCHEPRDTLEGFLWLTARNVTTDTQLRLCLHSLLWWTRWHFVKCWHSNHTSPAPERYVLPPPPKISVCLSVLSLVLLFFGNIYRSLRLYVLSQINPKSKLLSLICWALVILQNKKIKIVRVWSQTRNKREWGLDKNSSWSANYWIDVRNCPQTRAHSEDAVCVCRFIWKTKWNSCLWERNTLLRPSGKSIRALTVLMHGFHKSSVGGSIHSIYQSAATLT